MVAGAGTERTRPLKVGLLLPDHERQFDGKTARWSDTRNMAQIGEAIGVDSLWVTDHLIHRSLGVEPRGAWECLSQLAALAAITKRAELGTLVICMAFRNPALLAKMTDTIEEISGGRLILGIGAGWNEAEFQAFGYPFDHRVGRFEEALQVVRPLLDGQHVTLAGQWTATDDAELLPAPGHRVPHPLTPSVLKRNRQFPIDRGGARASWISASPYLPSARI